MKGLLKFFERPLKENPVKQGAWSLLLIVLFAFPKVFISGTEDSFFNNDYPWIIMGTFVLNFCIFNALFYLTSTNRSVFRMQSLYTFICLLVIGCLLSYLFSGVSLFEAGTFSWILSVISFCYLVFLVIVTCIRVLTEYAQREEWLYPKIRKKSK
jgi:NhaP-type Na+/H+ or K+/H+ antiporter